MAILKQDRPGKLVAVIGFGIFCAGLLIYIGKKTGWFPSVPFAGFAAMATGGGLVVASGAKGLFFQRALPPLVSWATLFIAVAALGIVIYQLYLVLD
jgi:hypothetical protein